MLVTKKRLYTELCRVLDTVHGLITCVEIEKENRKSDKQELLERIDWIEMWATKNLNKLDQRIDYVLDEIHALGELKPAKKTTKKKGNKMANETKKEYSRYVYQVLKGTAVVATFCIKQDAEEMAAQVGGEVYTIGAY